MFFRLWIYLSCNYYVIGVLVQSTLLRVLRGVRPQKTESLACGQARFRITWSSRFVPFFFRWTTSYSHPARPTSPPSACWESRARSRMHNRLLRVGKEVGKAFILFKSEGRNVGNCRAAEYEYILLCLIRFREAKKWYSLYRKTQYTVLNLAVKIKTKYQ